MKFILLAALLFSLLLGCSKQSPPAENLRPQFDIRSADVVTAIVTKASVSDNHQAEIHLTLTDECTKRYEPFGQKHAKEDVDILANGKLLLQGLYANSQISTQWTVFIFTSVSDAHALADSLNKK